LFPLPEARHRRNAADAERVARCESPLEHRFPCGAQLDSANVESAAFTA
jgi:hypothetical protein